MKKITVFSDGGARGNPGPAATGYLIYSNGQIVAEKGEYIGVSTNNIAEYLALKKAMDHLLGLNIQLGDCGVEIEFLLDSQLVVNQILGVYKIKKPHLQSLSIEIKEKINLLALAGYKNISFKHIPRVQNKEADSLVNQAIDSRLED